MYLTDRFYLYTLNILFCIKVDALQLVYEVDTNETFYGLYSLITCTKLYLVIHSFMVGGVEILFPPETKTPRCTSLL